MNGGGGADPEANWVVIARLDRARGNRGEMLSTPLGGPFERYQGLQEVFLSGSHGPLGGGRPYRLERLWNHRGRWVFKFQGIDTISAAEQLKGAQVCIPAGQRPPAGEGSYFVDELMGCQVFDRASGALVGQVAGWREYGGPPLVEISAPGRDEPLLVPFARTIFVEIDIHAKTVVVDLPEGLGELNQP